MQYQDESSLDTEVGKRFREIRTAKGLTQANVAARLESSGLSLDPTAITRIEKGTRALRLGEASAIAAALETSLSRVLSEVTSPEEQARAEIYRAIDQASEVRIAVTRWMVDVAVAINSAKDLPEAVPGVPPDLLSSWMHAQMEDKIDLSTTPRVFAPDDDVELQQMLGMLSLMTRDLVFPQGPPDEDDD